MRLTTNWVCPECREAVAVDLDVLSGVRGSQVKVRVRMPDTALADVFAHAWNHHDRPAKAVQ